MPNDATTMSSGGNLLKLEESIEKLMRNKEMLGEAAILELCEQGKAILEKEENMRRVPAPVVVVGDIHGQFSDMRKIFDMEGWPPEANYLFLGDYQGRGPM